MIPLRAVITNHKTHKVVRWVIDCYNQKATIKQIDDSIDNFPTRLKRKGKCSNPFGNPVVVSEALIIDKILDGVFFRGIHVAEWTNDYIIWSDIKNPSIPQMLKEYVYIVYNYLTKLRKHEFDVVFPEEDNRGVSFAGVGKLSKKSSITPENLRERKAQYRFMTVDPDSDAIKGRPCLSQGSLGMQSVIPKIRIVEKGTKYHQGQILNCCVQNQNSYTVQLRVVRCGSGGTVLKLEYVDQNRDYSFLHAEHQITKITGAGKSKSRTRYHGLRIAFEYETTAAGETVARIEEVGKGDEGVTNCTPAIPVNDEVAIPSKAALSSVETRKKKSEVATAMDTNTNTKNIDLMNNIVLETKPMTDFIYISCNNQNNRKQLTQILLEEGFLVQEIHKNELYKDYFYIRAWKLNGDEK